MCVAVGAAISPGRDSPVKTRTHLLATKWWRPARTSGRRRPAFVLSLDISKRLLYWLTDACCPAWSYNTCKTLLLSSSRLATTLLSLLYCCLATTLITATAVALWTWRFGFEIPFLASFALGQSEYTYLLLWWTKKYYYDIAAADNATTITNTATIFNRLCQKYKSAKKWISSRFPVPDMNWSVLCVMSSWCWWSGNSKYNLFFSGQTKDNNNEKFCEIETRR